MQANRLCDFPILTGNKQWEIEIHSLVHVKIQKLKQLIKCLKFGTWMIWTLHFCITNMLPFKQNHVKSTIADWSNEQLTLH